MQNDRISEILESRRKHEKQPDPDGEAAGDKFYSVLRGEGLFEQFLELQFSNGMQSAFSYGDLHWFNHDPDAGCMDCQFGEFLITIRGRGLKRIFQGIKGKRIAWIKEADSTMEDHPGNECYIEEILVIPPEGFEGETE